MKINIRSAQIDKSEILRDYIHLRLNLALDRWYGRIGSVRVWLRDVNGAKGGVDKSCTILLQLRPGAIIVVERDSSIRRAVDRAAERIAFRAAQTIGKRKLGQGEIGRHSIRKEARPAHRLPDTGDRYE